MRIFSSRIISAATTCFILSLRSKPLEVFDTCHSAALDAAGFGAWSAEALVLTVVYWFGPYLPQAFCSGEYFRMNRSGQRVQSTDQRAGRCVEELIVDAINVAGF